MLTSNFYFSSGNLMLKSYPEKQIQGREPNFKGRMNLNSVCVLRQRITEKRVLMRDSRFHRETRINEKLHHRVIADLHSASKNLSHKMYSKHVSHTTKQSRAAQNQRSEFSLVSSSLRHGLLFCSEGKNSCVCEFRIYFFLTHGKLSVDYTPIWGDHCIPFECC